MAVLRRQLREKVQRPRRALSAWLKPEFRIFTSDCVHLETFGDQLMCAEASAQLWKTPGASLAQPSETGHDVSVAESEFILKQVLRRSNVLRPRNVPVSREKFHRWSQNTLGPRVRWAFCPGFDILLPKNLNRWDFKSEFSQIHLEKFYLNLNLIWRNQHPWRVKTQKFGQSLAETRARSRR